MTYSYHPRAASLITMLLMLLAIAKAQSTEAPLRAMRAADTLALATAYVQAKGKSQTLREGAYSVNAIDVRSQIGSLTTLSDLVGHSSGINIRTEGGLGADYSLSVNGMAGNSIRYFVDGVPLQVRGEGVDLSNFPVNTVERIEIYKGVVPAFLGGDALGGAINIVTKRERSNFIDASVSAGSFSTYRADLNSQLRIGKSPIVVRPQLNIDYSKNDYKVHGVEVWDDQRELYDTVSRKRFHDQYFSAIAQLEAGVERTPWADQCYVGASYSYKRKELQTGAVQTIVYGKAQTQGDAFGLQARYQKRNFIIQNLSAQLSLSHTWDHSVVIDTAFRRYDWNGHYTISQRNETNGKSRQMRHYKRPLTTARANLTYEITPQHRLTLNYLLTRTGNRRYDTATDYYTDTHDYDATFTPSNDVLAKHVIGLGYDQSLLQGRMANTAFVKDYINHVDVEQSDLAWITHSDRAARHTVKNNIGYGMGSRFCLREWLTLKLSYERAIRLPQAKELLGNSTTIYPNLSLNPERSHNINAGLFGTMRFSPVSSLYYEVGGFYRITEDYIHLSINEADGTAQYENLKDVTTRGVEGEVRFRYADWLTCSANASYQESRDMERYLDSGNQSATYRNRVPNKPWLLANAELTLTKKDLLWKSTKLRFNYSYQYVHWFYLTWEGYGYRPAKSRIPTQHLHDASISYSWRGERFTLTLACHNIFDQLCYDNFRLQKPGRSLMAKFRLYLR